MDFLLRVAGLSFKTKVRRRRAQFFIIKRTQLGLLGTIWPGQLMLWTHWKDFPKQFWSVSVCFGGAGGGSCGGRGQSGLSWNCCPLTWICVIEGDKMRKYVKETPSRGAIWTWRPGGRLWVIIGHGPFSFPDMRGQTSTCTTVLVLVICVFGTCSKLLT